MAWYSSIADFILHIRDLAHTDRDYDSWDSDLEDGQGLGTGDGASVANGFSFFSTETFSPAQLGWAPTAADGVYKAFDVSQPVAEPEDLRGRDKELARLLSGVLHRRNHGVVSGPRGSGKTSLVRVFGRLADHEGVVVLYAACNGRTTFGELLNEFIEQIPSSSVDADETALFEQRVRNFGSDGTPHQAMSVFTHVKYSQAVIVVDEFDQVRDPLVRSQLASLLKLISDARLPVRFVLVGDSSTFDHIVSEHASLIRHVTRLSTDPLSDEAIDELLDNCAGRCDMELSEEAKQLLSDVACGSPYHARLFGMHAALAAMNCESNLIEQGHVLTGLAEGFEEWASLNRMDASAFRSIIDGANGDPAPYVEVARRIATTNNDYEAGDTAEYQRHQHDRDDQVLSGLASAVEQSTGGVAFRDSTAPQFLIALKHLSLPLKRRKAKGGRSV